MFARTHRLQLAPWGWWRYLTVSFSAEGTPVTKTYLHLGIWLVQGAIVAVTALVTPMLVCVMFAEADVNRGPTTDLPLGSPTDRTESDY